MAGKKKVANPMAAPPSQARNGYERMGEWLASWIPGAQFDPSKTNYNTVPQQSRMNFEDNMDTMRKAFGFSPLQQRNAVVTWEGQPPAADPNLKRNLPVQYVPGMPQPTFQGSMMPASSMPAQPPMFAGLSVPPAGPMGFSNAPLAARANGTPQIQNYPSIRAENPNNPMWAQANADVLAASDMRSRMLAARGQITSNLPPNQYARTSNPMDTSQQYVGQQMSALGYQPGAGINPAIAAQQNRGTDFRNGAGGAIGAGMAGRFGATGAMNPMGQPAGTYDMQVGGYGSPVQYNPMRNPTEVLGEMRQRALDSLNGDRNFKGSYVNEKGALTSRQNFLREQARAAAAAGDNQMAAQYDSEASAIEANMQAKAAAQKIRQQKYRDENNGGVRDFVARRENRALKRQAQWLRQNGIDPGSAEAASLAPSVYAGVRALRERKPQGGASNPMQAPFDPGGAPRTPKNEQTVLQYDNEALNGGVDALGNQKPPVPLYSSLGITHTDEMTVNNVHQGLQSALAEGKTLSIDDLRELRKFAASREQRWGKDEYASLSSWNNADPVTQRGYESMWKELAKLPDKDASLMDWFNRYKTVPQRHQMPFEPVPFASY